ncbi:MFS transporter [Streptomyces sp. NPDC058686]|uniref:MFS transporter n=1 Tax=Streptomyces sp. NPDC058686 TaxID=3346599 RepID=UPI00364C6148
MSSYAALLRVPHARRTFGAALLGRLSYGTVSLSLMLAVKSATGSYAVAGTAMALFGAASVFLSPLRALLIDRYGPRRALPPMTGAYAVLLGVLAALTWRPGASALVLGAAALAAGACTPPLGPTMRTVWSELVGKREGLLQRAYSLDGVAEELLLVSGPLIVGVVVQFAPAAFGVAVSAVLVAVGTAAFVSSPAVRGIAGRDAVRRGRSGGVSPVRSLTQPVVVAVGVGLALGALDLLVLAFADARQHADAVAWVMAALSAGSAVGGLANGAVTWSTPARTRLPFLAAGLAAALGAAAFAPGLVTLGAAAVVAGLFVAPALTTAYLVADETAGPAFRTQAGAWVNTAVNAGISAGTAGAGLLVARLPLAACFAVAAAAPVAAAVWGVRGMRGARTTPEAAPGDGAPDAAQETGSAAR